MCWFMDVSGGYRGEGGGGGSNTPSGPCMNVIVYLC